MNDKNTSIPISVKGKVTDVPGIRIQNRCVVVGGKFVKVATIHDEEWLTGETLTDPEEAIRMLKTLRPRVDLFSFAPSEPDPAIRFPYHYEWDNVAVIPTTSYDDWWNSLSQDARRNVRLAEKRGITIRKTEFDDQFVAGIKGIYDETPIRQGRRFWHYGKELQMVKQENSTYMDRSEYLGAYLGNELIGFIKMVYVGKTARIMQILSMNSHFDKKPANALIAKAVQISCERGMSHLAYCRYIYGTKKGSSITEFKRRNGFQELRFPRYFVPLTMVGRILIRIKLHMGIRNVIPEAMMEKLLSIRARFFELSAPGTKATVIPKA